MEKSIENKYKQMIGQ